MDILSPFGKGSVPPDFFRMAASWPVTYFSVPHHRGYHSRNICEHDLFCELRLCRWPDCNFEKRNGFDRWIRIRAEVISRDTQEKPKMKLPATLREWRVSIWISNPNSVPSRGRAP